MNIYNAACSGNQPRKGQPSNVNISSDGKDYCMYE